MDGVEPVGGIPVMAAPDPMEQLLALEMIRVTEAAGPDRRSHRPE